MLCDNGIASSLVVILDREYLSNGTHSTKPLAQLLARERVVMAILGLSPVVAGIRDMGAANLSALGG